MATKCGAIECLVTPFGTVQDIWFYEESQNSDSSLSVVTVQMNCSGMTWPQSPSFGLAQAGFQLAFSNSRPSNQGLAWPGSRVVQQNHAFSPSPIHSCAAGKLDEGTRFALAEFYNALFLLAF
jgi:hypothetical protein